MINIEKLNLFYDKKRALNNINLSLKEGIITTIIGPNGSGKSTLLKCLGRTLKYSSGSIKINNKDLKSFKNRQIAKQISFLPQSPSVPSDLKVIDIVTYGRFPFIRPFRGPSIEDYKIIDWAIESCNLKDFRNRILNTLSGGERQSVYIAMALAQQPKILLFDEPTTFLDISHQLEVLELIKEINKTSNITIVMVLHDINQALIYSDEIAVIKDGAIVCFDTPIKCLTKKLLKGVFNLKGEFIKRGNSTYFITERSTK